MTTTSPARSSPASRCDGAVLLRQIRADTAACKRDIHRLCCDIETTLLKAAWANPYLKAEVLDVIQERQAAGF